MEGHSILYLGRSDFAVDFIERLQNDDACARLIQYESVQAFGGSMEEIHLVLFEAEPGISRSFHSPQSVMQSLGSYPLVALTKRDQEHRGVAAVQAGAQTYICVDDISVEEQAAAFDLAMQRHSLLGQLSHSDSTVLTILSSINDGVIIVDRAGHVVDINPAGRSLLGMKARHRPEPGWVRSFCALAPDSKTAIDKNELPLVKARRGEKFSNQLAIYRVAGQEDIILNINGQGLFDSDREPIGGLITFRDVTDVMRRTVELEKRAQYDDLTALPNRRLFTQQLEKAVGRSQRNSKPLAVLFIDLDRFKSVNDTLGHDIGDELLRQVAGRLNDNLRVGAYLHN